MAGPVAPLVHADAVDRVRRIVAGVLQLRPEAIDRRTPLAQYGLDSLSAMELIAALSDEFQSPLSEGLLAEHPDLDSLVRALDGCEREDGTASLIDRFRADARLAPEIRPSPFRVAVRPPRAVLLTGATGFLGAYLLAELLRTTHADVYCLVRGAAGLGRSRIRVNLDRFGLWDDTFTDRIFVVSGDLSAARLGITVDEYASLTESIDAVYHAAAEVNWTQPYLALRDANVSGTRELLRFACAGRPKCFHFVSSLSVCYAEGAGDTVDEHADMLPLADRLPLGYAQTKTVAESLVREAAARGLPAVIHRPSLISGDSVSGASNLDDLLAALIKGCIEMGAAPDLDWAIDAAPVDHVARAIVALADPDGPTLQSFHLTNRHPRHWRECVLWINLLGYPCELLPYREWLARLDADSRSPQHALHRLRGFFLRRLSSGMTTPEVYQDGWRSPATSTATKAIETARGLRCPDLDAGRLDRYFAHYVAQGFLPPPRAGGWSPPAAGAVRAAYDDVERIQTLLRAYFQDSGLDIKSVELLQSGSEHSIIGELTSWRHGRRTGLYQCRVAMAHSDGAPRTLDVMLKAKPADTDVLEVAEAIAGMCGDALGRAVSTFRDGIGVTGGHVREPALYQHASPSARLLMPEMYGAWRDDANGEWGVLIERLDGLTLMDTADQPWRWTPVHVDAAIDGLAALHAAWAGRVDELRSARWMGETPTLDRMTAMTPLWLALADHAEPLIASCTDHATAALHGTLARTVAEWWPAIEGSPRTLIHNDFNPRNVALRHASGGTYRLCAYDWELATIGAPQRDLAEFLCFTLGQDACAADVRRLVERHRRQLAAALDISMSTDDWRAGFRAALAHVLVDRLAFYAMIHRVRRQSFLPRVLRTWRRLHEVA